eukprot:2997194-Rhodomonas_salina.1
MLPAACIIAVFFFGIDELGTQVRTALLCSRACVARLVFAVRLASLTLGDWAVAFQIEEPFSLLPL